MQMRSIVMAGLFFIVLTNAFVAEGKSTNFTVRDINGRYVRLSDFQNKVLLMSFFATWCKPCLTELKHLEKFYREFKSKGFVVLAISTDGPESRDKVKPLVKQYKFTFPVVFDAESQVVKLYNPKRAQPFSVLMKNGKVVKTREAFHVSDLPHIRKEIENLLDINR